MIWQKKVTWQEEHYPCTKFLKWEGVGPCVKFSVLFTAWISIASDTFKMLPTKDPIWRHFLTRERQNKSHVWAYCCDSLKGNALRMKLLSLMIMGGLSYLNWGGLSSSRHIHRRHSWWMRKLMKKGLQMTGNWRIRWWLWRVNETDHFGVKS